MNVEKLKDILKGIKFTLLQGDLESNVIGLSLDSRKVKQGYLFAAISGTATDGHLFIEQAMKNGAGHLLVEKMPGKKVAGISYILVENSALALAYVADNFYGHPSGKLKLVGVSGTNGKTTTATLLYNLLSAAGYKCGLISTIRILINGNVIEATHTTPDSIRLNELLAEMASAGCTHCFMEVSSHSVVQHRIAGLEFKGGIFTNLTRDHLDYHKTFKNYINAKKQFYDALGKNAFAVVNADDKHHEYMVQNTRGKVFTYGLKNPSDFKAKIVESNINGLHMNIGGTDFYTDKAGRFNAYNIMGVFAMAVLLGMDRETALGILSKSIPVDGRFEIIPGNKTNITGIVDYAHTPDALENVLKTINDCRKKSQRIITVFGCGGNRDKGKRPMMGKIAAEYSDFIFVTSDNPRLEEPDEIIRDILHGIPAESMINVLAITDREQAIKAACTFAANNDIILVAGKGHETYQDAKGKKTDFDDRIILKKYLTGKE